jgi:hypothetical protein
MMKVVFGGMKNLRLEPVRGSSIKIVALDKKDYFSREKRYEIFKSGESMGRGYLAKEKRD